MVAAVYLEVLCCTVVELHTARPAAALQGPIVCEQPSERAHADGRASHPRRHPSEIIQHELIESLLESTKDAAKDHARVREILHNAR